MFWHGFAVTVAVLKANKNNVILNEQIVCLHKL